MNKEHFHHIEQESFETQQEKGLLKKGEEELFLQQIEKKMRGLRKHVELDKTRSSIISLSGEVMGFPVLVEPLDQKEDFEDDIEEAWIYVKFEDESLSYVLSGTNTVLETRPMTKKERQEMKESFDKGIKKVTGRGMGSYPQEFLLDYKEVWPKNADILVVGDPYQKCDRERVTIIDYEYADEILPNISEYITKIRNGELSYRRLLDDLFGFFDDLHTGDKKSIEFVLGGFTPKDGNPYDFFVNSCVIAVADFINAFANNEDMNSQKQELSRLQKEHLSLRNGTWRMEDYEEYFTSEEEREGLELFFEVKEHSIHPDKEIWNTYKESWMPLLEKIPEEVLKNIDMTSEVKRVKYWLGEVGNIEGAVPNRIQKALQEMQSIYEKLREKAILDEGMQRHAVKGLDKQSSAWNPDGEFEETVFEDLTQKEKKTLAYRYLSVSGLSDTFSRGMMSDGAFGLAIPGIPINHRVDGFLEDSVDFVRRMQTYLQNIYPELEKESSRLEELGVDLGEKEKEYYLHGFEKAMVKEQLHKNRATKAMLTHGYFPYNMNVEGESFDKILGLYSLSTHVWDTYSEKSEFLEDIESSLAVLRSGGDLILGPINYKPYRQWNRSGSYQENFFAGDKLYEALKELKDKGLIEFYFKKADTDDDEIIDTEEFGRNDFAATLVITKK